MSYKKEAPVRHTCPMIDEMQTGLKDGILDISEAVEKIESILGDIRYYTNNIEDIRDANRELRSWGEDLVSYIESLESEHENALRAMRDEIDNLAYRLNDALTERDQLIYEINELRIKKYAGTL